MHNIACQLADLLYEKSEGVTASKDQIRYGIEVVLGACVKGLFIFAVALLHGHFALLCSCLLAFGLVRMYIGGIHLGSLWQCSIVSSLLLNGIVVMAIAIPQQYIIGLSALNIVLFGIITYYGPTTMRQHLKGKLNKGLPFISVIIGVMGISIFNIIIGESTQLGRGLLLATLASGMLYFRFNKNRIGG